MTKPETTLSRIPKEFVVNRQGKDHVLYAGLLDLAHREGNLRSIRTTLIQAPTAENGHTAIVHASVELAGAQTFDGIGDANPDNVGRMIAAHAIRMAETRAKARALRDALNIGGTAAEELGGEDDSDKSDKVTSDKPAQRSQPQQAAAAAAQPASVKQQGILARLRQVAGNTTPVPLTLTAPAFLAELDTYRSRPATAAQHARLVEAAARLFDECNVQAGDRITDELTMSQAEGLYDQFQAEYQRLAPAQPAANVTPIRPGAPAGEPATEQQVEKLRKLHTALGAPPADYAGITADAAAKKIADLVKVYNNQAAAKQPAKAR